MKLLIVEDNPADYLLVLRYIQSNEPGAVCHQVSAVEQLSSSLAADAWDVVLSDFNVPGLPFHQILAQIRQYNAELPIILVSGALGEDTAVELLKQGVWDFVSKDRLARLLPAIRRAVSDASERRKLRETDELFRNTVDWAPFGIIIANDQQQMLLVNPQAETMFGYQPGELLGQSIEVLIPEAIRQDHRNKVENYFNAPWRRLLDSVTGIQGRRKDGSLFPLEITLNPQRYQSQAIVTATIHDISERKQNEAAIKRHTRALEMLSKGNRALLRCTHEEQLLNATCQIVVKAGGYRMAWVGYKIEDDQHSVQTMAKAGYDQGYLQQVAISWADDLYGQGPVGATIRSGQIRIVKDLLTDAKFVPWREQAKQRDYRSIAVLPLKKELQVFGVLAIYANQPDAFDEFELPLLEELAHDLSFGINALRSRLAHAKAENDLKASHSLLETTLESTVDGIVVTSLSGRIIKFNRKFADIWRLDPSVLDEITLQGLFDHVVQLAENAAEFSKQTQMIYAKPEGTFLDAIELKDGRVIERVVQPHYMDGEVVGHVCNLRDISERRRYESRLTYLAHHDELTGLPNRSLFYDRMKQAIAHASRSKQEFAVLFLDLDRFKLVNDSLGHDFGDLLLLAVAQRLPAFLREEDTLARLGGDEFAVLLTNLTREGDAATVAIKLLHAAEKPYLVNERAFMAGISIGIAVYPRDGKDNSSLLRHADAAMYRAKESGGNAFKFYAAGMDAKIARHLEIAEQLQYALSRKEFQVFYQPQINVDTGAVIGAEALLRWRHPILGMVSPAEFIPIAEESQLILNISEWVLESVFAHCCARRISDWPSISVAINLSVRQFESSNLPEVLQGLLQKFDQAQSGCSFELEITEGMVMRQPEQAVETLIALKAMRFNIAIDDFGTGYSSLAYLKRFPIDKLKIDRSFIRDIPGDQEDVAISSAIIVMAHELGMKVVAEGVETDDQLSFLRLHDCDYVQGYLTGRPMSAADFEAFLIANRAKTD